MGNTLKRDFNFTAFVGALSCLVFAVIIKWTNWFDNDDTPPDSIFPLRKYQVPYMFIHRDDVHAGIYITRVIALVTLKTKWISWSNIALKQLMYVVVDLIRYFMGRLILVRFSFYTSMFFCERLR